MNIRSVRTLVEREGVSTTGRLAAGYLRVRSVDRLRSAVGPTLGVERWASYNRRRNELVFDPRSVADPFEKRWVDPTRIRYRPRYGCFDKLTRIGSVRGGPWDQSVADVADHPTVRGLRERFEGGYAWEDTTYFTHNVAAIEAGDVRKGCSTAEEFLGMRCAYVDDLFERIRDGGYQTQETLDGAMIDVNRFTPSRDRFLTNEVGINVGRDGSLFINSGFHRTALAQILRLDAIPVQVIVRHWGWQRTREKTLKSGAGMAAETAAHGGHPDLLDVGGEATERVAT